MKFAIMQVNEFLQNMQFLQKTEPSSVLDHIIN